MSGKFRRIFTLTSLIPHLTTDLQDEVIHEVLAAIRTLSDDHAQGNVMTDGYDTEEYQRVYSDDRARVDALTSLVPHVSEDMRGEIVHEALSFARALNDEYGQADALSTLAPYLPLNLKEEALNIAHTISAPIARVEALAGLVPHLSNELSAEVSYEASASPVPCPMSLIVPSP